MYFLGAKIFRRVHEFAYPSHSLRTCGSPVVLASTTIFKKCGVRTNSGKPKHIIAQKIQKRIIGGKLRNLYICMIIHSTISIQ